MQPENYELQQNNIDQDEISIFVNEMPIKVSSHDPIYEIDKRMGTKMRYVFNGQLLLPSLSFGFSGICNGAKIIGLPPPEDNYLKMNSITPLQKIKLHESKRFNVNKLRQRFEKKWSHNYRDPDDVFEKLRNNTDPTTANESALLSDLFKTRMENNRFAYRKICQKIITDSHSSFLENNDTFLSTIIPSKSLSPSTGLLPGLS